MITCQLYKSGRTMVIEFAWQKHKNNEDLIHFHQKPFSVSTPLLCRLSSFFYDCKHFSARFVC